MLGLVQYLILTSVIIRRNNPNYDRYLSVIEEYSPPFLSSQFVKMDMDPVRLHSRPK